MFVFLVFKRRKSSFWCSRNVKLVSAECRTSIATTSRRIARLSAPRTCTKRLIARSASSAHVSAPFTKCHKISNSIEIPKRRIHGLRHSEGRGKLRVQDDKLRLRLLLPNPPLSSIEVRDFVSRNAKSLSNYHFRYYPLNQQFSSQLAKTGMLRRNYSLNTSLTKTFCDS